MWQSALQQCSDAVKMAEDLEDTKTSLVDDKKFFIELEKGCDAMEAEWAERCKARVEELLAFSDIIKILNGDDALELFKKILPDSYLLQTSCMSADAYRVWSPEVFSNADKHMPGLVQTLVACLPLMFRYGDVGKGCACHRMRSKEYFAGLHGRFSCDHGERGERESQKAFHELDTNASKGAGADAVVRRCGPPPQRKDVTCLSVHIAKQVEASDVDCSTAARPRLCECSVSKCVSEIGTCKAGQNVLQGEVKKLQSLPWPTTVIAVANLAQVLMAWPRC